MKYLLPLLFISCTTTGPLMTHTELANTFPPIYREQALANLNDPTCKPNWSDGLRKEDIPYLFAWELTPQGYDYWNDFYEWMQKQKS